MTKNPVLETRTIQKILDNHCFFIPAYQRGYRWKKTQVEQLLTDIWDFRQNFSSPKEGEEKPFYCLQPVVVKPMKADGQNLWEVIDGQQRLTTIRIILEYLNKTEFRTAKKTYPISYATREDSFRFISENIDNSEEASTNIDFFHIHSAYNAVDEWFMDGKEGRKGRKPNEAIKGDFHSTLINDVRIIWYEVNEGDTSSSIDIFTRLNIGKIPLTNSELIKALFLQKSNFLQDRVSQQQIQIASEWDAMESDLQDDAFWYFVYNPESEIKYENRIEFIFDLLKNRKRDDEDYFTFYEFQKDFLDEERKNRTDITAIWKEIKTCFQVLEGWYKNRELYHLIGFLIDCGTDIKLLIEKSKDSTKTSFLHHIKAEIRKKVDFQISDLEYGDKEIKKILLLFNVQTILNTKEADLRFPFYRYKKEKWDIEHVRSQTDLHLNPKGKKEWAKDVCDFLAGELEKPELSELPDIRKTKREMGKHKETEEKADPISSFIQKLNSLISTEKIDDEEFNQVYDEILDHFGEYDSPADIHQISNLALLDAATNRSYKNAIFPIKRKRIIQNDMTGVFVPICTKNLFLKFYSKHLGEVMYWKESDANDYLAAIKSTLIDFLPNQENNDE